MFRYFLRFYLTSHSRDITMNMAFDNILPTLTRVPSSKKRKINISLALALFPRSPKICSLETHATQAKLSVTNELDDRIKWILLISFEILGHRWRFSELLRTGFKALFGARKRIIHHCMAVETLSHIDNYQNIT